MIRSLISVSFAAVLVPTVASAEFSLSDYYVGGFAGVVFSSDAEGTNDTLFSSLPPPNTADLDFDPDGQFALGLVVGARVAPQFRAEIELSYSRSDVDGVTFSAPNPLRFNANGDLTSVSLFVNGWYELEIGQSWRPYVGGGIGYTNVDADINSTAAVNRFDDSDGGFSYQLGVGVTIPVGTSGTIDVGYRYKETQDLSFKSQTGNADSFDNIDFTNQTFQIGYNMRF